MKVFGFDCESTVSDFETPPKLTLWTIYGSKLDKEIIESETGKKRPVELKFKIIRGEVEKHHGTTTEQFVKLLKSLKENCVFVAYNLKFDWTVVFNDCQLSGDYNDVIEATSKTNADLHFEKVNNSIMGQKPRFASISFRRYCRLKRKRVRITHHFVDLGNFVAYSDADNKDLQNLKLETIAKAFGFEGKLEPPPNYEFCPELIEYCYQDSKICYDVYSNFFFYPVYNKQKTIKGIKRTIASVSFATLIKSANWTPFNRSHEVMATEKLSYYGGRTWVNPKHQGKRYEGCRKIDVVSMYPHVMYDMKVPVAFSRSIKKLRQSERDLLYPELANTKFVSKKLCIEDLRRIYKSDTHDANINVTVKLIDPCLPVRGDTLQYPSDVVLEKVWYQLEEILPLHNMGSLEIISVNQINLYKCEKGIFNNFINYYFDVKCNSSGAKRMCAKLMLNASYGKFAERIRRQKLVPPNTLKALLEEGIFEFEGHKIYQNNGVFYIQYKLEKEQYNRCTQVSAIITAKARVMLWKKIKELDAIYCDTDSVVIDHEVPNGDKNKLGDWTHEGEFGYFIGYAPKYYDNNGKITLKGVPPRAIEIIKGVYVYDNMVSPREAIRVGIYPYQMKKFVKIMDVRASEIPDSVKAKIQEIRESKRTNFEINEIIDVMTSAEKEALALV